MLKVVTFLSTLRDPTHVRQWWCATRQQHPKYAPRMQEVCKKDEKGWMHKYAKCIKKGTNRMQKCAKSVQNVGKKCAKSVQKVEEKYRSDKKSSARSQKSTARD